MAGIGHGHELPAGAEPASTESHAIEGLQRYSEITAENIRSFHFHGQQDDYPLNGYHRHSRFRTFGNFIGRQILIAR